MILCLVSPHLPQQIDFSVQDLNVIPNQVCQTMTQLQLPARLEAKAAAHRRSRDSLRSNSFDDDH
jgi:hypothetical protein